MTLLLLLRSPGTLTGLSVVDSNVLTSGAVAGVTTTFTLPTISDSNYAAAVAFQNNQTAALPSANPTSTGWTAQNPQTGGTTLNARLYTKSLTPADSGTTVSLTWDTSAKIAGAIVVVQNTGGVDTIEPNVDSATDTALDFDPTYTPGVNNVLPVMIAVMNYPTTGGVQAPPVSGWSELRDDFTSGGTPLAGGYVAVRDAPLTGGAGVPQSFGSATFVDATGGREVSWLIGFKPVSAAAATFAAWGIPL